MRALKSHKSAAEYVLGVIGLLLGYEGWQYATPWLTNYLGALLGNIVGFLFGGFVLFLVVAIPPKRINL